MKQPTKIVINKTRCNICNGVGLIKVNIIVCSICDGLKCIQCNSTGLYQLPYIECNICDGLGEIRVHPY